MVIFTGLSITRPKGKSVWITKETLPAVPTSNLKNEKELQEFVLQLEDRFGVLPEETRELIEVIRLRKIAIKNGIEQLRLKNNLLKCYFITNQESLFYQSESFTKVLNWLQRNSSKADLREINNKLVLSVKNIKTIYQAVEVLSAIQ